MQKINFVFKYLFGGIVMLAIAGICFTSCKKDSPTTNNSDDAGLLPFNLAPGTSASIAVGGSTIITGALNFSNYTGEYIPVAKGTKVVDIYKYGQQDSVYASTAYEFGANKFYSLFLIGFNKRYKNLIVEDKVDSSIRESNKAYVRYINAIADSGDQHLTVTRNTTAVLDTTIKYTGIGAVRSIEPAQYTFTVSNGTVTASKTVVLDANKLYTIILFGVPSSTDDATKVKVTSITNGSL